MLEKVIISRISWNFFDSLFNIQVQKFSDYLKNHSLSLEYEQLAFLHILSYF